MKTVGESGRYINQSELGAFRGAGYELLGKADISALKKNNDIWKEGDLI